MRKPAPPKALTVIADEEQAEISEEPKPEPFALETKDEDKDLDKELIEKEGSQPESDKTLATNIPARSSLEIPQHITTEKEVKHT